MAQGLAVSDDLAVQATNDDATSCKKYAVSKGYWKDDFIKYFCKSTDRKSPEINRGYYARVKLYQLLIGKFLSLTGNECQIVNFGAGYDTLYWTLGSQRPKLLVEIDFSSVTTKKAYYIKSKDPLKGALIEPVIDKDSITSRQYHLMSGDLRNMSAVGDKLLTVLDTSLPTLFLTECVLVYMDGANSKEVIKWAGTHFPTAVFVNYEPIFPNDSFGEIMQANLAHRGCSLLGINSCPDLESQRQRFLSNGWSNAWTMDMAEVYKHLPPHEVHRIERLEFLDEKELLIQLLQHYCVSCGFSDKACKGLDKVSLLNS